MIRVMPDTPVPAVEGDDGGGNRRSGVNVGLPAVTRPVSERSRTSDSGQTIDLPCSRPNRRTLKGYQGVDLGCRQFLDQFNPGGGQVFSLTTHDHGSRADNGGQFKRLAGAALHSPVSHQWKGYWQRAA